MSSGLCCRSVLRVSQCINNRHEGRCVSPEANLLEGQGREAAGSLYSVARFPSILLSAQPCPPPNPEEPLFALPQSKHWVCYCKGQTSGCPTSFPEFRATAPHRLPSLGPRGLWEGSPCPTAGTPRWLASLSPGLKSWLFSVSAFQLPEQRCFCPVSVLSGQHHSPAIFVGS